VRNQGFPEAILEYCLRQQQVKLIFNSNNLSLRSTLSVKNRSVVPGRECSYLTRRCFVVHYVAAPSSTAGVLSSITSSRTSMLSRGLAHPSVSDAPAPCGQQSRRRGPNLSGFQIACDPGVDGRAVRTYQQSRLRALRSTSGKQPLRRTVALTGNTIRGSLGRT